MKKLLLILALLSLSAIGGCLGLRYWLENSYLPERLGAMKLWGEPVFLRSPITLSGFPVKLTMKDVSWQGHAGKWKIAFTAQEVRIQPDLLAIISGMPEISELEVEKPVVYLEVAGEKANESGFTPVPALAIGRLLIQEGMVRYADETAHIRLEELRLSALNLRPKHETSLQCDFGLIIGDTVESPIISGNFALKTLLRYYAPNLTFRETAATFTEQSRILRFTPCQAQLAGAYNLATGQLRLSGSQFTTPIGRAELSGESAPDNVGFAGRIKLELGGNAEKSTFSPLVIESPFTVSSGGMKLPGASAIWHSIQAYGEMEIDVANPRKLLEFGAELAGGRLRGELGWKSQGFSLAVHGKDILLGDVLAQAGLAGFAGGKTSFDAAFRFVGTEAAVMRRSISGSGSWTTRNLELEPFGDMSLLLPLLGGVSQAVPKSIDKLEITLTGRNGVLSFTPIRGIGPNFSGSGFAKWNLIDNELSGACVLRTPGLQVPLAFTGPPSSLDFSIEPKLLQQLP